MKKAILFSLAVAIQTVVFADDTTNDSAPAPVKPNTQDVGFNISGSFIYWKNMEANLNYAIVQYPPNNQGDVPDNDGNVLLGTIHTVDFNFDPGFKLEAGYKFGMNSWDLFAEYTYFKNNGSSSVSRSPAGSVSPYNYIKGLFYEPFASTIYNAKSNVSLTYNVIDLVLQRPFYTTETMFMKFFVGGRGSWITQDWNTIYNSTLVATQYEKVNSDWKFKGGGLRMGLNLDWDWGYGFGFHFLGSAAAILGHYSYTYGINQSDTSDPFLSNENYPFANISTGDQRIVPAYQILTGLSYRYEWDNNIGLSIFADWEINGWSDLHQAYSYPGVGYDDAKVGSIDHESVVFQGLTLGARLDF